MHAYQSAIAECRLDKHGSDQRPGDRLAASFEETQRADGIFQNREHAYLLTGGALQNLSIMSPDIELLLLKVKVQCCNLELDEERNMAKSFEYFVLLGDRVRSHTKIQAPVEFSQALEFRLKLQHCRITFSINRFIRPLRAIPLYQNLTSLRNFT